ncbi:hypothetical protein HK096_005190 [Nowakowskiella sp. JEL0078]|nr:hypothetical protein HK096_005190 [Nowakowskiella sp. JEL0078]
MSQLIVCGARDGTKSSGRSKGPATDKRKPEGAAANLGPRTPAGSPRAVQQQQLCLGCVIASTRDLRVACSES